MQLQFDEHFSYLETVFLDTYQGDIPKNYLERYTGKSRARLHYTSRLALQQSLNNSNKANFKLEELKIVNHKHMEKDPRFIVSLSHTNDFAMASSTTNEEILSIGVDLESPSRELKEGIKKFYILSEDEIENPLHLWCIKEAAFKALSPLYKEEKQLVLKDITVFKNGTFKLNIAPNLSGHWKLESTEKILSTYALILRN